MGSNKSLNGQLTTPIVLKLRAVLGSTDLSTGKNRFTFALLNDRSSIVRASSAKLSLSYVGKKKAIQHKTLTAPFIEWPHRDGGIFATNVDFPHSGTWLAEVSPSDGLSVGSFTRFSFEVNSNSSTTPVGTLVPKTKTKTSHEVPSLSQLTSDPNPDPDLYKMSIAQAIETKKPLLLNFSTPAFCTSTTCGPQLDIIKKLKNVYEDKINSIHVEIYENPHEMKGNYAEGIPSPVVKEWNLPTEPWTFLVDGQGRMFAKFEGFSSYEEIAKTIILVLDQTDP
jgi:hypothetical protein